ncbi:MAG: hypothetical protein V3V81_07430 [Candidatus Bathyarchaeia archaeon]
MDTIGSTDANRNRTRYNILYSNTDTMLPVLYSETPRPEVRATNLKDQAARHAAEMLEKVLVHSIDEVDFNYMMERSVKDYLLPGLATCRVKMDTAFKQEKVEDENGDVQEEDRVALQSSIAEYVNWDDYIVPETTSWDDRPWEAFRGRLTFEEVTAMFGDEEAQTVEYTVDDEDGDNRKKNVDTKDTSEAFKKATIYEIWDKEQKEQIFISKGGAITQPLEINEDPLGLKDFFPTPRPLLSITTNNTILPVPLFLQYQDQADELDIITERITALVDMLRRRGAYDAAMKELNKLSTAHDNEFVPIKDLARLQDKGGLSAVFMSEDVTPFANVLLGLYNQREQILKIIFQIVGISDIQRAATDPRETAAAQRIKARYGTLRISRAQRDVQRFIRDILRLQSEIIINTFTAQSISTITGIPLDSTVEKDGTVTEFGVNDLLEKLKNQEPASVMVDIETDSTLAADDIADREKVVEFNTVITDFATNAAVLQGVVGTDVTAEMLLSIVRRFSMGRGVEQAIIDQIDVVKQQQAEQEQQPSAEQLEAQAKQAELQQKAQQDNVENKIKFGQLQLKDKELNLKAAELGLKDNIAQQKVDLEGIGKAIDLQKAVLDEEKFKVEAANPDVNVVVGV